MKKLLLLLIMGISTVSFSQEISLDKDGDAVAYIDTDDDLTIYLWSANQFVIYMHQVVNSMYMVLMDLI